MKKSKKSEKEMIGHKMGGMSEKMPMTKEMKKKMNKMDKK